MNKKMKQMLLVFINVSFLVNSFGVLHAQTDLPEQNDKLVAENSGEQIKISDVSLGVPSFEQKIYQSGDVVGVTLSASNNDNIDYSEMTFSAQITVYAEDGKIKEYGRQDNLVEFFLSKQSSKDVSFEYKIPASISSSVEDEIRIEVQAIQKTGELFGNTSNSIQIEHIEIPFELSLAAVNVGEKFYTLQEGPVINTEEVVQVTAIFNHIGKETITLYPKLKVYDLDSSRPLLESKEYESIELVESSYLQTFIFDMPQMSKPGVYAGELIFVDQNNIPQTSLIATRWIIDGDMATISRVSIDKTVIKNGEEAIVDVVYTGPPQNIDTGEARQVGKGVMTVTLYNEKNKVIGSQEKEVDFSTIRSVVQFEITATTNAKSITAHVVAQKDGQELASYKTNLTDPEVTDTNPLFEILYLFAVILVLLVILFVYKKTISKKIIIPGLAILMFLGITQVSYASKVVVSNDLYVHNNLNKTNFTPGESMRWNLPTQIQAYACNNQGGNTALKWTIGGSGVWLTGDAADSYPAVANTCGQSKSLADLKCNLLFNSNVHAESWRLIDAFYPGADMNAPSTPGTYTLTVKVWHTARFKDGGTSNPIQKGPATFTYSFTVACPAGQNWNGWSCVAPPAINGSCNNSVVWACNAGTAANGSDQGTWWQWTCEGANGGARDWCGIAKPVNGSCGSSMYSCTAGGADSGGSDSWNIWWRCAGTSGGADAWCSVPVPPAPTNISTQCSPAGNAVAMYWTNQPGYDRVYFRNYDNTAQAHYGTNDNYQNNWAYLTGITPGHSYSWWIHTRGYDGRWSTPVGQGYVCTAQQPSNFAVSCAPNGTTATFSWTNPAGYDSIYFRNYDDTVGGWGTTYAGWYGNVENLKASTYQLTSITPGHNYHAWIHTRDAVGNYGPAVHANFACTVQQPANLNVSCSVDGRTATFSWTNPGAYNRVYFRAYDHNTAQNTFWNDDIWGTQNIISNITPGNNYSWWIHSRDAAGQAGPAVSGNFTCVATPADQCTNVSGIQASVPASATKNADGTCSCSVGKHFEGAVCVDDVPVSTVFSVSCSAPAVALTDKSIFKATVQNNTGAVTYKWKEKDNTTYISGATNSIFEREYSTVDSHRLYIEVTDQSGTITNYCNANVDCDNSHAEGETTACDINGNQNRYTCTSTGWKAISQTCGGGIYPTVTQFEFSPNIVSAGNKCGLTLSASNVASCTLISLNGNISVPVIGTSISLANSRIVPIGRYSLSCTNVEGTLTKEFGSKSCIINPDFKEN